MKKLLPFLLCFALLCGCGNGNTTPSGETEVPTYSILTSTATEEIPFASRFTSETLITLSDSGITVDGGSETDTVYTSNDIIYYECKTAYESGYPYGEGTLSDMHTDDEALAHTVVNITAPGTYRVTGTLSAGQIRVDLGEDAYSDKNAVVELILDKADITCTVAPAVLFLNVYECDGNWSTDTATPDVDTSAAGANLILHGENTLSGSYVAKIYKDKDGEKKLWKQDGAIYSYMSMNVYGPGSLDLTAANEGLDTELHLTINGGSINIRSDNDGINTNEDGVSVTTINAGTLHIIAGLGEEGDGIDSNGYLVINGGTVVASANPAADAGMDSDLGSFVNGGVVIALGSTMDWAESDSEQVTMNLQFADFQNSGTSIVIAYPDGTVAFAYDPSQDEVVGTNVRRYMGAVISTPNLHVGQSYEVYLGSAITGTEIGGVYDCLTVTGYTGGTKMMYTGTDVNMHIGGMGMPSFVGTPGPGGPGGGQIPDGGFGEDFTHPEGDFAIPEQPTQPEYQISGGRPGQPPEGEMPTGEMPGDFEGGGPQDGQPEGGSEAPSATLFHLTDKVNAFSGVTAAQ